MSQNPFTEMDSIVGIGSHSDNRIEARRAEIKTFADTSVISETISVERFTRLRYREEERVIGKNNLSRFRCPSRTG